MKVMVMRRMRMILATKLVIMKMVMPTLVLMRALLMAVVTMLMLIRKSWMVMLTIVRMMVLMVVIISEGNSNGLHFRINMTSRLENQLNEHEFEQTQRDGGSQGSLACYNLWRSQKV